MNVMNHRTTQTDLSETLEAVLEAAAALRAPRDAAQTGP